MYSTAAVSQSLIKVRWLTTHPVESSFRSDMQRKLRLQPPLSLVQSLTGPNESRRTSNESKDELIINSSLLQQKWVTKKRSWFSCVHFWGYTTEGWFELWVYNAPFIEACQVNERLSAGWCGQKCYTYNHFYNKYIIISWWTDSLWSTLLHHCRKRMS